jgi:hypothetical protein
MIARRLLRTALLAEARGEVGAELVERRSWLLGLGHGISNPRGSRGTDVTRATDGGCFEENRVEKELKDFFSYSSPEKTYGCH